MRGIKTTTISILAVGLLAGSAVGVAAQDEESAAEVTSFTGTISGDGEEHPLESTEVVLPNGFTEATPGWGWLDRFESSDPRFTGDHSVIVNWVIDPNGFEPWSTGGEANLLTAALHEVANDGGSWLGESRGFGSTELDLASGEVIAFVGQDGYEGLTAYVRLDPAQPGTFSGVIFPSAMPEVPEPYVAE